MAEAPQECPIALENRVLSTRSQVDVLQQAEADQTGKHAGTAIGEEGQGNARHRHQSHGHADVLESLECEPCDHTYRDQSSEHVLTSPCDSETSEDDDGVEKDDRTSTEESELFSCDSEDEVSLLLRNETSAGLWSIEESGTSQPT